jgi:predicted unusual protein kinase regulating ubiquinone biosynthesis (AarF/ABC1/UbiB family)
MSQENSENSFTARMKRYAQVSTTVGGLLARLMGEKYLGVGIKSEEHSEKLKESLGQLKGPLMKVAQILATVPDMLPPEYAQALQELQSNAPPMGWLFVKRRMKSEMGPNWEEKFEHFEHQACAAASLGQVHRAQSLDGQILACKLQYPDMESAVQADLGQLKFVLSAYEKSGGPLSTKELYKEISERLYEELNYELEAQHIHLFQLLLAEQSWAHIPKVIPELSSRRLLSMTWLEGRRMLDVKNDSKEVRNQVAENMFRLWYTPLYHYGIIHGDPHLGNYTVRQDLGINLLDFGCIRIFPPDFIEGVIELYRSLLNNKPEQTIAAYEKWGFRNLTKAHIKILNLWAGYLYGPLLDDRVRPIDAEFSGVAGKEAAGKMFTELRKIGGVDVPREFVFMDRAAVGLGSVFLHLRAELNWHQMFEELIDGFDKQNLIQQQNTLLGKVNLRK